MDELVNNVFESIIEVISLIDNGISNHSAKNFIERDDFIDAMLDVRRLAVLIRDECVTTSATPVHV